MLIYHFILKITLCPFLFKTSVLSFPSNSSFYPLTLNITFLEGKKEGSLWILTFYNKTWVKCLRSSLKKGTCLFASPKSPSHPQPKPLLPSLLLSYRVQWDLLRAEHGLYPLKLCLTNLGVSDLDKSRVATMLIFRFSQLPILVVFLLRRKEDENFIKFLPHSYLMFLLLFSFSLTFPLPFVGLQYAREHFLLGPTFS